MRRTQPLDVDSTVEAETVMAPAGRVLVTMTTDLPDVEEAEVALPEEEESRVDWPPETDWEPPVEDAEAALLEEADGPLVLETASGLADSPYADSPEEAGSPGDDPLPLDAGGSSPPLPPFLDGGAVSLALAGLAEVGSLYAAVSAGGGGPCLILVLLERGGGALEALLAEREVAEGSERPNASREFGADWMGMFRLQMAVPTTQSTKSS